MNKTFYIIGHNPNTIASADEYLSNGANAIEPDINIISGTDKLCVSHEEGDSNTITLENYFFQLVQLKNFSNLTLVYLDCKPSVIHRGLDILTTVRKYLDPHVSVVLSVSSIDEAKVMFPSLVLELQANEFLLIDEENDPVAVSNFFHSIGSFRYGYGNGDSVPLIPTTIFFPHVEKSIVAACKLRDQGNLGFVFTWTFNSKHNQKFFLNAGVDGMIVDLKGFPCIPGLDNIKSLLKGNEK